MKKNYDTPRATLHSKRILYIRRCFGRLTIEENVRSRDPNMPESIEIDCGLPVGVELYERDVDRIIGALVDWKRRRELARSRQ